MYESVTPSRRCCAARPGARRRAVRAAAFTGALAAIALLIGGCGGGGANGTTGGGGSGSTLTIAMPQYPPSLDPAVANNAYSDFFDLAYDPLIVLKPDGSFTPGLATSWSYGPRNESFTVHLRPGVRFSDGTALTAAAVKAWIEYTLKFPGGQAPGYISALKSIYVTGPLSLTLRFSAPTPNLPLVFSQVLEVGEIGSPAGVAGKRLNTGTDGAGEYMIDQAQTVTGDHYTYVPNPHYWNKSAVHWKKVVIKVIANPNAALDALETAQVDVAETQPITLAKAAQSAGLKFDAPLTLYMAMQFLDMQGKICKPCADLRVRQALNYAVDRSAIAKVLGLDAQPIDQMAVPGDDDYDPSLANAYPYDLGKAKQLLAAAGYPHGFTLPLLSLNLAQQNTLAEALTGQFAKIGVTLKPNITTSVGAYATELTGTKYPAVTLSWGRLPAAAQYQSLWGPDATAQNPFKTDSPAQDAIYAHMIAAPPAQVSVYARQMQRFLVSQAWFVPVAATPLVEYFRPQITGVNATPQRDVDYSVEYRPG